jgi:hypothetical protein
MSRASATLDRVNGVAGDVPGDVPGGVVGDASVRLLTVPAAAGAPADDDDLLDSWLASLSVDEFARFLSGLADLR